MKIVALLILFSSVALASSAPSRMQLLKRFPLEGSAGWDYLTYDSDGGRLFVTRGVEVVVLDANSGKQIGKIAGTAGVHGVALAQELGRVFTSNGQAGTVGIFDLKTLNPVGSIKVGEKPDAILFDSTTRKVFAFNGKSGDVSVIDAEKGKVNSTLKLGGSPEFAVSDGKGAIFVNLEDRNRLVKLDAVHEKVLATWPLGPCEEPTGLSIDLEHRRLFAGCGNQTLVAVNADTGKVVATLPIGAGVDATAFDPKTKQVYSSNGKSGTLTVIHQDSADQYHVVENAITQVSARTLALDSSGGRIFLVAANFTPPVPGSGHSGRGKLVPGTVSVLVMGAK